MIERRPRRVDHLLEVVRDDEHGPAGGERLADAPRELVLLCRRREVEVERAREDARERRGVARARELTEEPAAREERPLCDRDLGGEARLAHARRAPDRDEARARVEEATYRLDLGAPAHEARRRRDEAGIGF